MFRQGKQAHLSPYHYIHNCFFNEEIKTMSINYCNFISPSRVKLSLPKRMNIQYNRIALGNIHVVILILLQGIGFKPPEIDTTHHYSVSWFIEVFEIELFNIWKYLHKPFYKLFSKMLKNKLNWVSFKDLINFIQCFMKWATSNLAYRKELQRTV